MFNRFVISGRFSDEMFSKLFSKPENQFHKIRRKYLISLLLEYFHHCMHCIVLFITPCVYCKTLKTGRFGSFCRSTTVFRTKFDQSVPCQPLFKDIDPKTGWPLQKFCSPLYTVWPCVVLGEFLNHVDMEGRWVNQMSISLHKVFFCKIVHKVERSGGGVG